MNALDLPAPPPPKGPLTYSEMAREIAANFEESHPGASAHEIALRINLALASLIKDGLVREWGFDEKGRTTYEPCDAFDVRHPAIVYVVFEVLKEE